MWTQSYVVNVATLQLVPIYIHTIEIPFSEQLTTVYYIVQKRVHVQGSTVVVLC